MNRTARIQKRLILLIAFSITWIFIGSLVIFHQEQVMGKTFKWSHISCIVPKSKDERTASKIKASLSTDHSQQLILAVLDDNQREQVISGVFSLLHQTDTRQAVPECSVLFSGLRAPPAA
jgi:hypothetical protein